MSTYLITGDHKWKDLDYIRKYLNTLPKGSKVYHGGHTTGVESAVLTYGSKCKHISVHDASTKVIKYEDGDKRVECFRLLRMCMEIKPDILIFFHNEVEIMDELNKVLDILSKHGYEIIIVKNTYYA